MSEASDVFIVGAGAAGLAAAACLKRRGLEPIVVEASNTAGHTWANNYESLKLHTIRRYSGLPYYPMPRSYPLYPTRSQVLDYLQNYARHFGIVPRFGQHVERARRDQQGWLLTTQRGDTYRARVLVAASGIFDSPIRPTWPGMESFRGSIQHSSEYRTALPFTGKRVLIIGAGNSGAEIALDLAGRAASVTVAIRNGVNVVPLSLLGVPIQLWGLLVLRLPPEVSGSIAKLLLRRSEARLQRAGVPKSPEPILASHGIPIIGLGLLQEITAGKIAVNGAVAGFDQSEVIFADGSRQSFDAVLLATGFTPALQYLRDTVTFDARGFPERDGMRSHQFPDLFFAGYNYGIAGTLNNIRKETPILAEQITALGQGSGS